MKETASLPPPPADAEFCAQSTGVPRGSRELLFSEGECSGFPGSCERLDLSTLLSSACSPPRGKPVSPATCSLAPGLPEGGSERSVY